MIGTYSPQMWRRWLPSSEDLVNFGNPSYGMRKSKMWRWFSTSHLSGVLALNEPTYLKSETLCPRQIRYTYFGRKSPTEKRAEKIRQDHACCSLCFSLICIMFKAGVRFSFPANTHYWTSGIVESADTTGDIHMSCQLSTNCLWRVTAAAVASGDANVCCGRRLGAHQSCFACDAFSITNVCTL